MDNNKLWDFIRRIFMCLYQLSNTMGFAYAYALYHYTLGNCKKSDEDPSCFIFINKLTAYLCLSSAFFQYFLMLMDRTRHGIKIHIFSSLYNLFIQVSGLHAFLLKEFIFAYRKINNVDEDTKFPERVFLGFAALAFFLGCCFHKTIRETLLAKIGLEAGRLTYAMNCFFEGMTGYVGFKSVMETISQLFSFNFYESSKRLYIFYFLPLGWALLAGYSDLRHRHDRAIGLAAESVERFVERDTVSSNIKYYVKASINFLNDLFWSFVFAHFVVESLRNEKEPHQTIQWSLFGILLTVVLLGAGWTELRNKPEHEGYEAQRDEPDPKQPTGGSGSIIDPQEVRKPTESRDISAADVSQQAVREPVLSEGLGTGLLKVAKQKKLKHQSHFRQRFFSSTEHKKRNAISYSSKPSEAVPLSNSHASILTR